jgi:hypothetical protein
LQEATGLKLSDDKDDDEAHVLKPDRGGEEDGMDANAEADAQRRLAALVQTAESMQQDIHMQPDEVAAGAWTDLGRGLEGRKRGRQESDGESSSSHSRPKSSPVGDAEWIQKSMMEHYMMLQMLTMVSLSRCLSVSLLPCPLCFHECVCKRGR